MVTDAHEVWAELESGSEGRLRGIAKSLASTVGRAVRPEEAADVVAQAAACAAPILAAAGPTEKPISWLREQLAAWEHEAIRQAKALSTKYSLLSAKCSEYAAHALEHFLQSYDRSGRKKGGVFFTPPPIADYIVAGADRLLREHFSIAHGLADEAVAILDPACGTGTFLLSVIDCLQNRGDISNLLPRLIGVEILPAAALVAKLNMALKLGEAGCSFPQSVGINIIIGDALSPHLQSKIQDRKSKIPVLLGNPPFSSLSTTTNDWIARLVRGDEEVRGYVRANGQRLEERKTWLHDDYVKFIRVAQWHIEQAGRGIVGFVTNHGFLDNATFRLMRQELLRVFPYVEIVDLHGNRKKHETAPCGGRDENVFGLDQGLAISFFVNGAGDREEGAADQPKLRYAELWGSRTSKLSAISHRSFSRESCFTPTAPDWRFIPHRSGTRHSEYEAAWSIADAMPVGTTAPVTARDHFVVAFTAEELRTRIEEFRDVSIPDEEIRRRHFQRTRSARYPTGDTRGWKLAEARRIVAADRDWSQKIVRCLYRPFDWRYVFWHPAMIDWPRNEITRHLTDDGQKDGVTERQSEPEFQSLLPSFLPSLRLCLIARRQQLPTQPCTFFWISDGLALDGVIRSDNRGSESLFPLYLHDKQANFALPFIEHVAAKISLGWSPLGSDDWARNFGPQDLLAYIYGLFHSNCYRERYADALRSDFPRVLVPSSGETFARISRLGAELIALHLLRDPASVVSTQYSGLSKSHETAKQALFSAADSDEAVAGFRAGGYVALRKWLQPKQRTAANPEYAQIAAAIGRTIEIMPQIDRAVEQSGGWARNFGGQATA